MNVKKYRAASVQQALQMVRAELGPDAAVLETRELPRNLLSWFRPRQVEVTAARDVQVAPRVEAPVPEPVTLELQRQLNSLKSLVEGLQGQQAGPAQVPETCFRLFADLIDAELSEELARELIDRVCEGGPNDDDALLKARICRLVEEEIHVGGPIEVHPGQRRVVALIGPTGVGKTTTIAKLAANFHLRQRRRVGLITVDTYRIPAVEQLRTYADIIDLPMEVVSTPREMRQAVDRFAELDLVLMDTAGRSPSDDVKIQELKTMLAEAQADEAHLVLSSVSSTAGLRRTAERFSEAGATSLLLTKLDEATGLGAILPLLRSCPLPLSYLTNGQNVPDDIEPADGPRLARMILGAEPLS